MDDLFNGPGRQRRAINLGGAAPVSQREVFEQARASRHARLEERRRQEAATQIQALWRGIFERRTLYPGLRRRIGEDVTGLDAMKCLALLPGDDEALGQWSHAMCAQDDRAYCLFSIVWRIAECRGSLCSIQISAARKLVGAHASNRG